MSPSHKAWLCAHPHRGREWLSDRMADGFEVHHIDGDHGNNDPLNLVLIERRDHGLIHLGVRSNRFSIRNLHNEKRIKRKALLLRVGKATYDTKINSPKSTWAQVRNVVAAKFDIGNMDIVTAAKSWATETNGKWPLNESPKFRIKRVAEELME